MTLSEHDKTKSWYLKSAKEAVRLRDWITAAHYYRLAAFHSEVAKHLRKAHKAKR